MPKLTKKKIKEKQLIELLCDKGGFVLVRCEKDWGGTYGWTTKSNPNSVVNGYKTEEMARMGFIKDSTRSELASVMLEMLFKYYKPATPMPKLTKRKTGVTFIFTTSKAMGKRIREHCAKTGQSIGPWIRSIVAREVSPNLPREKR